MLLENRTVQNIVNREKFQNDLSRKNYPWVHYWVMFRKWFSKEMGFDPVVKWWQQSIDVVNISPLANWFQICGPTAGKALLVTADSVTRGRSTARRAERSVSARKSRVEEPLQGTRRWRMNISKHNVCTCIHNSCVQSWGLRPLSYDKTGLRPASVLVLVLYFWSCFQHCCAPQDMIMLKCNKHLLHRLYIGFRAISTETVPNVTDRHFLTSFYTKLFLITNMPVATEELFLLCVLAVA